MGEMVVSTTPGAELVAIGLGSCIGLVLTDLRLGIAGLAHIVLPDSMGKPGPVAKFANLAVPALIEKLLAAGAERRHLQAVLIGGAQMFITGSTMEIGVRNTLAVRDALGGAGIPIFSEDVGGSSGRTARVVIGRDVSSQAVGGPRLSLLSPGQPARPSRGAVGGRLTSARDLAGDYTATALTCAAALLLCGSIRL
jgi:chemotaxis protein CheD